MAVKKQKPSEIAEELNESDKEIIDELVNETADKILRIKELEDKVDNLLAAFAEQVSLTGTGAIMDKYGLTPYKLTAYDLNKGIARVRNK